MVQPRYFVTQRYDKRNNTTRYRVIQAAGVSIVDFESLVEAVVVARYLNMDSVTYNERKIALNALKRAEGYNIVEYPDLESMDTTIPDPTEEERTKT